MDDQLFPQSQPRHESPMAAAGLANMSAQVTNLATRLKLAEERYSNLTKRNQITEESLLSFERDMKSELRAMSHQAVDVRKHLQDINGKLDAITAELGAVVQKHEFSTVERYLDMWQPMQFLTRDEAKRLIVDAKAQLAEAIAADAAVQVTQQATAQAEAQVDAQSTVQPKTEDTTSPTPSSATAATKPLGAAPVVLPKVPSSILKAPSSSKTTTSRKGVR